MHTSEPTSPIDEKPNGQGSIYQRVDGLWIGAAYVLTATGHRRRITVSSRSEKEAARKLRDKITKSDKGIPVAGESWTVEQYFEPGRSGGCHRVVHCALVLPRRAVGGPQHEKWLVPPRRTGHVHNVAR